MKIYNFDSAKDLIGKIQTDSEPGERLGNHTSDEGLVTRL